MDLLHPFRRLGLEISINEKSGYWPGGSLAVLRRSVAEMNCTHDSPAVEVYLVFGIDFGTTKKEHYKPASGDNNPGSRTVYHLPRKRKEGP